MDSSVRNEILAEGKQDTVKDVNPTFRRIAALFSHFLCSGLRPFCLDYQPAARTACPNSEPNKTKSRSDNGISLLRFCWLGWADSTVQHDGQVYLVEDRLKA